MVERNIHHRTLWERDVILLTSILRLHCQPPPSYKLIAELLIKTWSDIIWKLAKDVVSIDTQAEILASEAGTKNWLTEYLQQRYELAEEWGSELWITARDKDRSMAEEILRVTGLNEMGYEVIDEEEMQLQMKWKKEDDWRYGSTPEPIQAEYTLKIPPVNTSKLAGEQPEPPLPATRKIAREIFQVLSSKGHNNSPQERDPSTCRTLKDIAKRIEVMSMVETELKEIDRASGRLKEI